MQTISLPTSASRNNELQMHTSSMYESTNSDSGNRRSFIAKSLASVTLSVASPVPLVHPYAYAEDSEPPVANFAPRRAGAVLPSLTKLPPSKFGLFVQFGEGMLYSNDASRTPGKDVFASFNLPADWLQLDRFMGGVQFVDQRNGDKVYMFKVEMPKGIDALGSVPKAYFADAIFNPKGDLVRTGNNVEEYKILSSQMLTGEEEKIQRRRMKVKYTTLTGNNFSVERKGIIDAYEYSGMVYMLMTGSNAVLFDKKGRERETIEYMADSFLVTPS